MFRIPPGATLSLCPGVLLLFAMHCCVVCLLRHTHTHCWRRMCATNRTNRTCSLHMQCAVRRRVLCKFMHLETRPKELDGVKRGVMGERIDRHKHRRRRRSTRLARGEKTSLGETFFAVVASFSPLSVPASSQINGFCVLVV